MTDIDDDFLQFILNQLHQGYSEYKKNHPDFALIVEKEERKLKGNYGRKRTHCESCGEWLEGFDTCSQCGRINT